MTSKIKSIEEQLAEVGLSKNEIRVYLTVLKLGETGIGKIENASGLHRQIIYNAARALQDKNLLVIKEIRGRRVFAIDNPRALQRFAEWRLDLAKGLVSDLFAMANISRQADRVRSFKGVRGVHQYYLESIERQSNNSLIKILGVNSSRYFEIFKKEEAPFQVFERIRLASKIKIHLLLFGAREEEIKLNKERKYLELKTLQDNIVAPMDIMIWQNHVGMLFYSNEPYILDITGQEITGGFISYFEALWKRAEKIISAS